MTRRWPFPRLAFARSRADGLARAEGPGDERFHSLILPHLDAAWTYARYLTRDPTVAEDVVQEAFLRAWRAQAGCKGDGRAWLMAIVRNCWHDWLHDRGTQTAASADLFAESVAEDTPHSLLERQSDAVHLHAMLTNLPEPFREALVLRELEDLSYRDIAEVTGAPIGTVMSRLARGREMLATLVLTEDRPAAKGRIKP
jgi:RNA polymerase sigma-70 factor (ECF subfamily)